MAGSGFEKKLISLIEEALPGVSPGVQVQVHQNGRKVCDVSVGETYPYYDFASVTKIIFTVQAMMMAFDQGQWNLKSKVQDFVPWFAHDNVLVRDLLTHSAGLVWWHPFYQSLDLSTSELNRWSEVAQVIRSLKLEPQHESIYSDVSFLMLAYVLEAMNSMPLNEVWTKVKEHFYSRSTLDFNEGNKPKHAIKFYAPTQRCPWRGKLIQGEVQDENAWALGGLSTHSGLFGSIDDLGWFGLFLRSQIKGVSKNLIRQKTAQLFTTRARPEGQGDWALGYMMPTPGKSSSGSYFSPMSIGHTGFTGTSIWYDPGQDLSVAILSNRVLLGKDNKDFARILRPQIHNWVVEGLRRS